MAKSNLEKAFEKMTPAQRKKAQREIGEMMGMPPKKKRAASSTKKKGK